VLFLSALDAASSFRDDGCGSAASSASGAFPGADHGIGHSRRNARVTLCAYRLCQELCGALAGSSIAEILAKVSESGDPVSDEYVGVARYGVVSVRGEHRLRAALAEHRLDIQAQEWNRTIPSSTL
jgi:hypothetical protein